MTFEGLVALPWACFLREVDRLVLTAVAAELPLGTSTDWLDIAAVVGTGLTALAFGLALWQIRHAVRETRRAAGAAQVAADAAEGAMARSASHHLSFLQHHLRSLEQEWAGVSNRADPDELRRFMTRWRDMASWTRGVLDGLPAADMRLSQLLERSSEEAVEVVAHVEPTDPLRKDFLARVSRAISAVCDEISRLGGSLAVSLDYSVQEVKDLIRDEGPVALLHDDELHDFEASLKCEEIWCITADLMKDHPTGLAGRPFYDVVRQHVIEGGIYRYILHDDGVMEEVVKHQFIQLFPEDVRPRLVFHYLDDSEWADLPVTDADFGVYNPTHKPHEIPVRAVVALPHSGRTLWISLPPDLSSRWSARVQEIIDRSARRQEQGSDRQ